jgi:hypothetical protein
MFIKRPDISSRVLEKSIIALFLLNFCVHLFSQLNFTEEGNKEQDVDIAHELYEDAQNR